MSDEHEVLEVTIDNSSTKDTTIPTKKWNVWKNDYDIDGYAHGVLYSAVRFYGKGDKSKYYVTIRNRSTERSVHVMCKHEKKTYLEFDVKKNSSVTKSFNNIYPSTEWYLRFTSGKGPVSVKGSVK